MSAGVSPGRLAWRRLRRRPAAWVGVVLVLLVALPALLARWVAPYGYEEKFETEANRDPSRKHWMGLDPNYRDNLSGIVYGGRVSLKVALGATALSVLIGVAVGGVAGFFGGWVDEILMRVTDVVYAFPGILLAVAVAACFEAQSVMSVCLALGLVGWPGLARLVRGQALVAREEDYVSAARALGAGRGRILLRHVGPNCLTPVIVMGSLLMAGNILGEAGLGFLGISAVEAPHPSWGSMLNVARPYVQVGWWMTLFPGLAIALTTLGFNLLGDGVRDALDPKKQS